MFSSDDSITSTHAHFFELKMGVSAVCVFMCICVYTAGGLKQQWQMGRASGRQGGKKLGHYTRVCVCFSPVFSLKMLQYHFCFHAKIITVAIVYQ